MIPPPPFIQQGIKNQVLFASPHSISIRAYEDHKDEQSNIDDEDNDDDQNILNTQSNTFAKRTMKLCIDLLYPLSCPYTIVASGQQSASVLLIKKQDFYKVINQL
ncbi:MAG: hypothetical protein EZS28_009753 [Streblomastix strix]|uniref:Uncharacterized protein n=1 Tax=Streblomastix strix TaxID=222440 RepID=A0A5J4WIQ6_9EUKA|nr:MAG: hypothetical protein EZS28_009753 [Streblomastix strix]